jgi:hypothetical protein
LRTKAGSWRICPKKWSCWKISKSLSKEKGDR